MFADSMTMEKPVPELDVAYSCSHWTADGRKPDQAIGDFFSFMRQCYERNVCNTPHTLNVSYGSQLMDMWGDFSSEPQNIFVFIHGGYWQEGSKEMSTSMVEPLVSIGFCLACIEYDLAPSKHVGEIVQQITKALEFFTEHWPKASLTICGHSAGAHLAVKAIEQAKQSSVKRLILMCGLYLELEELVNTYIGKGIKMTVEEAREMNVKLDVFTNKFDGQILMLCAQNEAPKITYQNEQFYEKLLMTGFKKVAKKTIKNTNHLSIVEQLQDPNNESTQELMNFILNCS